MDKKWWSKTSYTILMIIIGSILFAIGVNAFILPHKLMSGGINGISLMIYYVLQGTVQLGNINLLLNIPILYAAWRWLGRWHFGITILGTVIISLIINWTKFLADYNLTHDPIVGAILGGIFCGLGLGVVYRSGGNTGGLDPIVMIIRNRLGLQMGSILFSINVFVLILGSFVVNIEAAAITLITLFITGTVTNKVIVGLNQRKAVFIISYKPYNICNLIIDKIGRGATILNGEGAYTHQAKQVILVVVGLLQVAKLKEIIQKEDPTAFLLITDAAEVIGAGFTYGVKPGVAERVIAVEESSVAEPNGVTKATLTGVVPADNCEILNGKEVCKPKETVKTNHE